LKKKVLVSADRNETRVAMLEAAGTPSKPGGKQPAKDNSKWRTAELYLERRGDRSIVGNVYKAKVENVVAGLEAAFVEAPARGRASRTCSRAARRSSSRSPRTR
jgi:ribonuclease G